MMANEELNDAEVVAVCNRIVDRMERYRYRTGE